MRSNSVWSWVTECFCFFFFASFRDTQIITTYIALHNTKEAWASKVLYLFLPKFATP